MAFYTGCHGVVWERWHTSGSLFRDVKLVGKRLALIPLVESFEVGQRGWIVTFWILRVKYWGKGNLGLLKVNGCTPSKLFSEKEIKHT